MLAKKRIKNSTRGTWKVEGKRGFRGVGGRGRKSAFHPRVISRLANSVFFRPGPAPSGKLKTNKACVYPFSVRLYCFVSLFHSTSLIAFSMCLLFIYLFSYTLRRLETKQICVGTDENVSVKFVVITSNLMKTYQNFIYVKDFSSNYLKLTGTKSYIHITLKSLYIF